MAGMSTDAVIRILKSSFGVWRKSLDLLKGALAVIFIFEMVLVLAQVFVFGIGTGADETAVASNLAYMAFAILIGIITSIIGLSMVKPIYAIIRNSALEDWLSLLGGQVLNLVKIVLANLAFFAPTIAAGIIFFATAFLMPSLSIAFAIIVLLVLVAQALVLAFMNPFIQQQVVIEGNGPIQALKESYVLAKENLAPIIVYYIGSGILAVIIYIPVVIGILIVSMPLGLIGGGIGTGLAGGILANIFSVFFYIPWSLGLEIAFWAEAKKARAPAQ